MELKALKGTEDDLSRLGLACDGCDFGECDTAINDQLEEILERCETKISEVGRWRTWRAQKERKLARRTRAILRNESRFRAFADYVVNESKQDLLTSGRVGEFGDGQFLKWWFEWFENGGAEKLIEFIGQLIKIIMTIASVAGVATALAFAAIVERMIGLDLSFVLAA